MVVYEYGKIIQYSELDSISYLGDKFTLYCITHTYTHFFYIIATFNLRTYIFTYINKYINVFIYFEYVKNA